MNVHGWLECVVSPRSSSAAVSVKDSNGTFVSTLSMILYNVSTQLILRHCQLYRGCETGCMGATELCLPPIYCGFMVPSIHEKTHKTKARLSGLNYCLSYSDCSQLFLPPRPGSYSLRLPVGDTCNLSPPCSALEWCLMSLPEFLPVGKGIKNIPSTEESL